MFQLAQFEFARLEHSQGGDDYHDMYAVSEPPVPAETDPERDWARGRIYSCSVCEDEIRVTLPDPSSIEGGITPPAP